MYLFGRKSKLRADHKPLLKIFAPDSATPVFGVGPHTSHRPGTKLNSSLLLKSPIPMPCPDYHCSTGRIPLFQKSSPSKGSCNKPECLPCPLLPDHFWAKAILSTQGWALCRARLPDVGPMNYHISLLTGVDSKWATQGAPRSRQLPAVMYGGME